MKIELSTVLSILSFLLALFLFIRTILQERKNIDIKIINVALLPFDSKRIHINVLITNKSKNPISISGVKITSIINYKKVTRYARNLTHRAAHTTKRNDNGDYQITQEINTDPIPIQLDGFGARYSLITFDLIDIYESEFLNDSTFVEFTTSRGYIKQEFHLKNYKNIKVTDLLDFKIDN